MPERAPTLTPWHERFRQRVRPVLHRIDSPVHYVQFFVTPELRDTARAIGTDLLVGVLDRLEGQPGSVASAAASLRAATGGEYGEPVVHPHHCGNPECNFDGGGYLGFVLRVEDFGPAFHPLALMRPLGRTDEAREEPRRG